MRRPHDGLAPCPPVPHTRICPDLLITSMALGYFDGFCGVGASGNAGWALGYDLCDPPHPCTVKPCRGRLQRSPVHDVECFLHSKTTVVPTQRGAASSRAACSKAAGCETIQRNMGECVRTWRGWHFRFILSLAGITCSFLSAQHLHAVEFGVTDGLGWRRGAVARKGFHATGG